MAICPVCGKSVIEGAAFCSECGSAGTAAATGSAGAAVATHAPMASNVAGLLTYVLGFITGIVFLVLDPYKNNRYVRFHAFQSIFFSVALVAFWIVWSVVSTVLGFASLGVLGLAMAVLGLMIALGTLAYWVFLMYRAYRGDLYRIPYVGGLAAKQAGEAA